MNPNGPTQTYLQASPILDFENELNNRVNSRVDRQRWQEKIREYLNVNGIFGFDFTSDLKNTVF